VNFADLVALSQNYGKSGKLFSQGDFNYNGTVDFPDLVSLAQRYNFTLPPPPPPGPAAPLTAATATADLAVQAPAPSPVPATAVKPSVAKLTLSSIAPSAAPQRKTFSVSRISHDEFEVPQRPKPAKRPH
jgi:hypothetical protein